MGHIISQWIHCTVELITTGRKPSSCQEWKRGLFCRTHAPSGSLGGRTWGGHWGGMNIYAPDLVLVSVHSILWKDLVWEAEGFHSFLQIFTSWKLPMLPQSWCQSWPGLLKPCRNTLESCRLRMGSSPACSNNIIQSSKAQTPTN